MMVSYCYKINRDFFKQIQRMADWQIKPNSHLLYPVRVLPKSGFFTGIKFKEEDLAYFNFRISSIWNLASNRHFYLYVLGKHTNMEFEDWSWKKRIPKHFKSFSQSQLNVPVMKYRMGEEEFYLYSLAISQHNSYEDYDYDYDFFAEAFCIILNYLDSEQGEGDQWKTISEIPITVKKSHKKLLTIVLLIGDPQ